MVKILCAMQAGYFQWVEVSPGNGPLQRELYGTRSKMAHSIVTRSVSEDRSYAPRLHFGLLSESTACSITGGRLGLYLTWYCHSAIASGGVGEEGVSREMVK